MPRLRRQREARSPLSKPVIGSHSTWTGDRFGSTFPTRNSRVAAPSGRADGDEDHQRTGNRPGEVGGEGQPASASVARHQVVETRLEIGDLAPREASDLVRILVDADDVDAEFRETGTGDQPNIAGSDDGNADCLNTHPWHPILALGDLSIVCL